MSRGYSFRPRGWALALALSACAAGIALGNWQERRAEEKRAVGARIDNALHSAPREIPTSPIDSREFVLQAVAARGQFVPERTVLLDNKLRHGRLGYEVITPLRLGPRMHVLVNRGWIAREHRSELRTPRGEVRISGLALEHLPRVLKLGDAPKGDTRQTLDIAEFAAETGLELQPIIIEEHAGPDDGLVREWPRPDLGIEKHEAYALQWYALAALAVVLVIVLSIRRVKPA
jgi:surfeit locus 1 family protein